jgi:hypothetical protein
MMETQTDELRRDLRRLLLLKVLAGEPLGLLVLDGMVEEKRARLRTARQADALPAGSASATARRTACAGGRDGGE